MLSFSDFRFCGCDISVLWKWKIKRRPSLSSFGKVMFRQNQISFLGSLRSPHRSCCSDHRRSYVDWWFTLLISYNPYSVGLYMINNTHGFVFLGRVVHNQVDKWDLETWFVIKYTLRNLLLVKYISFLKNNLNLLVFLSFTGLVKFNDEYSKPKVHKPVCLSFLAIHCSSTCCSPLGCFFFSSLNWNW